MTSKKKEDLSIFKRFILSIRGRMFSGGKRSYSNQSDLCRNARFYIAGLIKAGEWKYLCAAHEQPKLCSAIDCMD